MEQWYENELADTNEEDLTLKNYDITSSPNDFNIITLFQFIDAGIVKIPAFQRNYVWDVKRASKLIESILMGLPIPQVFLYEKEKNQFMVIDGQQRLLSIYFFMKQRFPTDLGKRKLRELMISDVLGDDFFANDEYFRDFKLNLPSATGGEKSLYNGLKYQTLGDYKNLFEYMRTIRCIIIKQNQPENDASSMFEIFNRLNSGGQNLTPQEIRMSLFYSKFYDSLIELNKEPQWRQILNNIEPDIHFKDVEILLRAFALLVHHEKYSSPMNKFLNAFSKETKTFSEELICYFSELFRAFLNSCSALNTNAFASKSGKFSISVFDAIFVAACDKAFKEKKVAPLIIAQDMVDQLKQDAEFIGATQDSVASTSSVKTRINLAKKIIM